MIKLSKQQVRSYLNDAGITEWIVTKEPTLWLLVIKGLLLIYSEKAQVVGFYCTQGFGIPPAVIEQMETVWAGIRRSTPDDKDAFPGKSGVPDAIIELEDGALRVFCNLCALLAADRKHRPTQAKKGK